MLSPVCVISYQPYYLEAARYAHGNKTANMLINQTKSSKESNDRFEMQNGVMSNNKKTFAQKVFFLYFCGVIIQMTNLQT